MPETPGRLIAIGDVHGCAHALDALVAAIEPTRQDHLVFLGDLIDQGHDTPDVLDRILDLQQSCQVVLIQGNHEEMLFAARNSERALHYWIECGGAATLNAYRFGGGLKAIPQAHWDLLTEGRDYFETDHFIFTHANYLSDLPMAQQPEVQLRWALFDPAEVRPHISGKTVVVGHTEQANSEICDLGFAVCIDTACWRHGWLTAIEISSRRLWQASRWGILRDPDEATHRGRFGHLTRIAD